MRIVSSILSNIIFAAHIFFDDAWEDQEECGRVPNEYFKTLFNLLIELTRYSNVASYLWWCY